MKKHKGHSNNPILYLPSNVPHTVTEIRNALNVHGWCVVRGVFEPTEAGVLYRQMTNWLKDRTQRRFDIDKEETWQNHSEGWTKNGMLFQNRAGISRFQMRARGNRHAMALYSGLLDIPQANLICSMDGFSFTPPLRPRQPLFNPKKPNLHVDRHWNPPPPKTTTSIKVPTTFPRPISIQSYVNLTTPKKPGFEPCLLVLDGSNNPQIRKEFNLKFPKAFPNGEWMRFESNHLCWLEDEKGLERVFVSSEAGDMVFWDSQTVHAGARARDRTDGRGVIYLNYGDITKLTNKQIESRKKYAQQG